MERIDTVDGLFHEGSPASGQKGTKVTAAWLNDLQETVITLSESTELVSSYDSLTAAVAAIGAVTPTNLRHGCHRQHRDPRDDKGNH